MIDPGYDIPGSVLDIGAVYLYNGASGVLISTLTGSTSGDRVGSDGVKTLPNGNYLVMSPNWDHGAAVDSGAVTWGSGTTGVSGVVSAANSLVGSTTGDSVGNISDCVIDCLKVLSNGHYLVVSRFWHNGAAGAAGAVTWGSGETGVSGVISSDNSLVGSKPNDSIGKSGVKELSNGNYLVLSPWWDNGAAANAGAVTWGNGTTGVSGVVSTTNSLVGSTAGDEIGNGNDIGLDLVTTLSNGNYVVASPFWDNGAAVDAGAVTWGSGTTGVCGIISADNSLVGSANGDRVGDRGVTALRYGNYVVLSPYWGSFPMTGAGAVTWGSGTEGVRGVVSAANSLVGSTANDGVGYVTALSNGNYVVQSHQWDNLGAADAGAVTWASGTTGVIGVISVSNSLVGSTAGDYVGYVTALTNGNYVVQSPYWSNGSAGDAGAVTWASGTTGVRGVVSVLNSLVGSSIGDEVGSGDLTVLNNGNYVVQSRLWDKNAVVDAGAVTWGSGTMGVSGVVSAANSLVGVNVGDHVGWVVALTNGSYVVISSDWDNNSGIDAGAVTWGNGISGVRGDVSSANSLVGFSPGDRVGSGWVTSLSNGSYLVVSPKWNNGGVVDAGAVTWGSGTEGVSGIVSAANSLIGSTANDWVGKAGVTEIDNNSYVVRSPWWDNGRVVDAGAVTWGSSTEGKSGFVSAVNSLVGSTASDKIGSGDVTALNNGSFVVRSPDWDNGAEVDTGAVTLGYGLNCDANLMRGVITSANSVLGMAAGGGGTLNFGYDAIHQQLVVGRPADNIVSLFTAGDCAYRIFIPLL